MNTHTAYTGKRDPINCPANQPDPQRIARILTSHSKAELVAEIEIIKEAARSVIDGWDGAARMGPRIEKLRAAIGENK